MRVACCRLVIALVTAASALPVQAQPAKSFPGQRSSYSAPPHTYSLQVVRAERHSRTAQGRLVFRGPDGREQTIWEGELPNNPIWAFVDQQTGWVVTYGGEERPFQLEHAVVVHDPAGRVVRDVRARDILTVEQRRVLGVREGERAPGADEHDRDGNDLFRDVVRAEFTPDAIWLTHHRWKERVLLVRRPPTYEAVGGSYVAGGMS